MEGATNYESLKEAHNQLGCNALATKAPFGGGGNGGVT